MFSSERLACRGVGRAAPGDRLLVVEHELLEPLLGGRSDEDRGIEVLPRHAVRHAFPAIVAETRLPQVRHDREVVDREEGCAVGDYALAGAYLPKGSFNELPYSHPTWD